MKIDINNLGVYKNVIEKLNSCKIDIIQENMNEAKRLEEQNERIIKEKAELKKAESNPSYIEIQMQIEEYSKVVRDKHKNHTNKIEIV
ncbi:hypothetical protein [Clostridium sp. DL1XJH146]